MRKQLNLDALTVHWSVALFAAEDALKAARACGGLDPAELWRREHDLVSERARTERLLEALAREERIPLHRRLTAGRAVQE